MELREVKAKLEDLKIKKAKAQERIEQLQKRREEVMAGLKQFGIKTPEQVDAFIAEKQKELSALLKSLDDIENQKIPAEEQKPPEKKQTKKEDADDLLKELGL